MFQILLFKKLQIFKFYLKIKKWRLKKIEGISFYLEHPYCWQSRFDWTSKKINMIKCQTKIMTKLFNREIKWIFISPCLKVTLFNQATSSWDMQPLSDFGGAPLAQQIASEFLMISSCFTWVRNGEFSLKRNFTSKPPTCYLWFLTQSLVHCLAHLGHHRKGKVFPMEVPPGCYAGRCDTTTYLGRVGSLSGLRCPIWHNWTHCFTVPWLEVSIASGNSNAQFQWYVPGWYTSQPMGALWWKSDCIIYVYVGAYLKARCARIHGNKDRKTEYTSYAACTTIQCQ